MHRLELLRSFILARLLDLPFFLTPAAALAVEGTPGPIEPALRLLLPPTWRALVNTQIF
jgi:hypothetical protein